MVSSVRNIDFFDTMEEADDFIKSELEFHNINETKNPWRESDFYKKRVNVN